MSSRLALALALTAVNATAFTPAQKAEADRHCETAKKSAKAATAAEKLHKDLDAKAKADKLQLDKVSLDLERHEETERAKGAEAGGHRSRVKERLQKDRGETGQLDNLASTVGGVAPGLATWVNGEKGKIMTFLSAVDRCVDSSFCSMPSLHCSPPVNALPNVAGADSVVAGANAQIQAGYKQAADDIRRHCSEMTRSYNADLSQLQLATRQRDQAKQQAQLLRPRKNNLDLSHRTHRQQADAALADAKRESAAAKTAIDAADKLMGASSYCKVGVKDYSAEVEKLKRETRALIQQTRASMR